MRDRRGSVAVVAVGVLGFAAIASGCASATPAFHPGGSASVAGGPAALSPAPGGAAGVEFETPLPATAIDRSIVLGYERSARARWARRAMTGPVRFFDTAVTGVYFGDGAAVSSCVAAAGRRYLEEATEGRLAGGSWLVTRVATYSATSSQGASCQ